MTRGQIHAGSTPGGRAGAAGSGRGGRGGVAEFGRFFLPGPTEVRPEVLDAMARAIIGHRGPAMKELIGGMEAGLRNLFQTARPIYISTSSATGLMEAAVSNLSRRRVLCLVCGAFSERFHQIALRLGKAADALRVEWGEANLPERVREALAADPGRYDLVTAVHSETSTGVLNPVGDLAEEIRRFDDVLFAVDAVSSLAGAPVLTDEWGLDFVLTGSQKALALPPGLALGAASERALERAGETESRSYYFDFLDFERRAAEHQTANTPAVSLLYALERQLGRIEREGLKTRWRRHWDMAQRTHTRIEEMSERTGITLKVLAPSAHRSPTVTAVMLPQAEAPGHGAEGLPERRAPLTGQDVAARMRERGWTIAPGYGKLKASSFRIGHMGDHTLEELDLLLDELEDVLTESWRP